MSVQPHNVHGAPSADDPGPKRSLILSGGGLRVSYQAGVIRALLEEGLRFHHIDGTSGGSLNLSMLLSGLSAAEICNRWRTLRMKDTISPLPLGKYLKARDLEALSDATGLRDKVLPHLGIRPDRIRAARGVEGTYNVLDYGRKTVEVIPHQQIDVDLIIAGMSLPALLPPVRRGDTIYLDTAFVQDANLMEAVRQGADELWVVWCLGNTNQYRGGPLRLYVQMLEMSANGALIVQFERVHELNARRVSPIRLHLIRPEYPLPLDSDLYLGRIDHATLIDMGYADAKRYLAARTPEGLPFEPHVLRTRDPVPGVTFPLEMVGRLALSEPDRGEAPLALRAVATIRDLERFLAEPAFGGEITARIECPLFGGALTTKRGTVELRAATGEVGAARIVYDFVFEYEDRTYRLTGETGPDHAMLPVTLYASADATGTSVGAGELTMGRRERRNLVAGICATNVNSAAERRSTVDAFGRAFLGGRYEPPSLLARLLSRFRRWLARYRRGPRSRPEDLRV